MYKSIVALFSVIYLLLLSVIIKYVSSYGWDDASITLAFGKTLANYGRYSLNEVSEIVEGSSSNLLVFLSAIITKLFQPNFYQIITWSQYNALFFSFVTFFLTYKLFNKDFNNWQKLTLIILISLFPMFFMEIINGMEMTMFSALLLLFIYFHRRKSFFIYCIIPFLLLVRFEAAFYLIMSLIFVYFFDVKNKIFNFKLLFYSFSILLILTVLRYVYFGQVLPNTVLAKMNPPYSGTTDFEMLKQKLSGVKEFIITFSFIILALVLIIYNQRKHFTLFLNIELSFIISFFIFSIIAGQNVGYTGRMLLPVLPIFILYFTDVYRYIHKKNTFKFIFSIIILSILVNYKTYRQVYQYAKTGGFYQHLYLPESTEKEAQNKMNLYFYGVTPENYKVTGIAIDDLRHNLELKTIKFMTPDVGGIGLSTDKIIILDSALLTNKFLANNGYSHFYIYLETRVPDVIETHEGWSTYSKIFDSSFFKDNYVPIIFENNFVWLHKKHIEKIKLLKHEFIINTKVSKNTRYFEGDILPYKNFTVLKIL